MTSSTTDIAVIGTGVMGRGIVQIAALGGMRVRLFDSERSRAVAARDYVADMVASMAAKGRITNEQAQAAKQHITVVDTLAEIAGVAVVVEAIVEDLEAKRALFRSVEEAVGDNTILATNTSSMLVTEIAAGCKRPQRVAGLHFFNPVPLMRVVEVIPGVRTGPSVIDTLVALVRQTGHVPVLAADSPGFLVNHAGRGLYTEGLQIVSEGVASVFDVDRVVRDVIGLRMGPFELFDLTGLDVSFPVLSKIYQQFYEEPRFRPRPLLRARVAAGLFGRKVGKGFYEYQDGRQVPVPEVAVPVAPATPVWVARTAGMNVNALEDFFRSHGIVVETGAAPSAQSIIVLTPLGVDATTAATQLQLPLERCMAIDTLIWPCERITLMPTVATRVDIRDSLHAMLGDTKVSVIGDSTGFIAQRIVATIVNIACDIAQQRIATPADIELAVALGLGYPCGPLTLGDKVGAKRILEVLDGIHRCSGDPRYRTSPWLRRRALAGISLLAQDAY